MTAHAIHGSDCMWPLLKLDHRPHAGHHNVHISLSYHRKVFDFKCTSPFPLSSFPVFLSHTYKLLTSLPPSLPPSLSLPYPHPHPLPPPSLQGVTLPLSFFSDRLLTLAEALTLDVLLPEQVCSTLH